MVVPVVVHSRGAESVSDLGVTLSAEPLGDSVTSEKTLSASLVVLDFSASSDESGDCLSGVFDA